MGNIKLSIVTVCKNEEKRVRRTIKSVLMQAGIDYEYIVLDGKSEDNTLDVLKSYEKEFEDKGVSYRIISKSDSGIYNAMNNALEYINGEWVIYLNAGDCFYSKQTTQMLADSNFQGDIVYGDVILVENGYYKTQKAADYHSLPIMMPFCHQSVFCRAEILKEYRFREKYRIAADYDLLLRAFIDGKKFEYIHESISIFSQDGQSIKNAWKCHAEIMKSGREVCGPNIKNQCKSIINSIIRLGKLFLANIFNDQYHSKNRGWRKLKKTW